MRSWLTSTSPRSKTCSSSFSVATKGRWSDASPHPRLDPVADALEGVHPAPAGSLHHRNDDGDSSGSVAAVRVRHPDRGAPHPHTRARRVEDTGKPGAGPG